MHSRFLKKNEVRSLTSLSFSHIDRLEKIGKFPKRVPITARRVAWIEADIHEWMSSCRKNANVRMSSTFESSSSYA